MNSQKISLIFIIYQFYLFDNLIKNMLKKVKSEALSLTFYIMIIIFFVQDPLIIFLLIDLMVLHIFLFFKKMTTYEFIILQRNEKEKNQIKDAQTLQNTNKKKPIIKIDQLPLDNNLLNPNCEIIPFILLH